jgi:hypothetical protein
MSYNIDTWKTKTLENLVIPVAALYPKTGRADWLPNKPTIDFETGDVTIEGGSEGFRIKGKMVGTDIHVTNISNSGEGSGSFENYVLTEALKQSKGTLIASRVWEGGDTIDKLTVIDGVVTEENVEI